MSYFQAQTVPSQQQQCRNVSFKSHTKASVLCACVCFVHTNDSLLPQTHSFTYISKKQFFSADRVAFLMLLLEVAEFFLCILFLSLFPLRFSTHLSVTFPRAPPVSLGCSSCFTVGCFCFQTTDVTSAMNGIKTRRKMCSNNGNAKKKKEKKEHSKFHLTLVLCHCVFILWGCAKTKYDVVSSRALF